MSATSATLTCMQKQPAKGIDTGDALPEKNNQSDFRFLNCSNIYTLN